MSNIHQALDAIAVASILPLCSTEGLAGIIDHFINGIDPLQTSPTGSGYVLG